MAGSVESLAHLLLQTQNRLGEQERSTKGVRTGTVVSIDDPDSRSRALVVLDNENENYIGAGVESVGTSQTYWVNSVPAFVGKLPASLVGRRVVLHTGNNDEGQLFIQDVVRDGMDKDNPAESSTMTRLPVYRDGSLPPASQENEGCVVVRTNGHDVMSWLTVCLKRRGGYKWVDLMDRLHIHDSQVPDSSRDREGRVNDDTHGTT